MPLTSAGFTAPTLLEIKATIENSLRAEISPTLDLTPSSPLGQMVDIFARQVRVAWEALAGLYSAQDPNGATGTTLDQLAALTGTTRKPATPSRAIVQCSLQAGTYPAGTLIVAVDGSPDVTFTNVNSITSVGTGTTYTEPFTSTGTGPIPALAGTLTQVVAPLGSFVSASNAADAVLGEDIENDAELRFRRNQDVSLPGGSTADAIASDLSDLEGVVSVTVLENDTSAVDANGLTPHSVEAIVYAPSVAAADIASTIYGTKPAGTGTDGTTTTTIQSSQGYDVDIQWTAPSLLSAEAALTIQVDAAYGGDVAFSAAVAEASFADLAVGEDLDWSDLVAYAMDVPGVLRVTAVSLGPLVGSLAPFGTLTADIRELVSLSSGDIAVTSSVGVP